jgi:hypothetical protein
MAHIWQISMQCYGLRELTRQNAGGSGGAETYTVGMHPQVLVVTGQ